MYLFRIKLHESIEDNHSGTTITKCLGQREQMRKAKLSTLALGIQVKKKEEQQSFVWIERQIFEYTCWEIHLICQYFNQTDFYSLNRRAAHLEESGRQVCSYWDCPRQWLWLQVEIIKKQLTRSLNGPALKMSVLKNWRVLTLWRLREWRLEQGGHWLRTLWERNMELCLASVDFTSVVIFLHFSTITSLIFRSRLTLTGSRKQWRMKLRMVH